MFLIKNGPNSTEADAWARMLDFLEGMGLPRDIRTNYEDFSQVLDFFTDQPRYVEYHVAKDTYSGNQSGKIVRAVMHVPEGEIQTAVTPPQETVADDPNADYCTYLGKKHKILDFNKETNLYKLEMVSSGRVREAIEGDKITFE